MTGLLLVCTMTAAPGDFESFWPAVDEAAVVRSQDPEFVSWQAEPACASCSCGHTWCENLSFFSGLDGSKQPQDLGVNAHMGARTHVNLGIPICKDLGIGAQIGTAMGYHDFAVGAVEAIQGSRERFQSFTTAGVFQRAGCWKWGIAYDFLSENYYEGINLGQWRGVVAGKLTPCDELGAWFTMSDHGDSATFLTDSLTLEPISQVNVYWRRTWATGAETSFWVGAAEPHGEEIILFAPASPTGTQLVYGADIHAPLNDRLAILGEANFITPSDSGTVDAYLGMVYYPWGDAQSGRSRCFAPALPVASNPTFSVDLRR